jgi:hypothetical protein
MISDCSQYGLVASYTSAERVAWATIKYCSALAVDYDSAALCELDLDACVLVGNGQAGLWVTDVCAKVAMVRSAVDILEGPARSGAGVSGAMKYLDSKKSDKQDELLDEILAPMALQQWLSTVKTPCYPGLIAGFLEYTDRPGGNQYNPRGSSSSRIDPLLLPEASKGFYRQLIKAGGSEVTELVVKGTQIQLDHLPVVLKSDGLQTLVGSLRQFQMEGAKRS